MPTRNGGPDSLPISRNEPVTLDSAVSRSRAREPCLLASYGLPILNLPEAILVRATRTHVTQRWGDRFPTRCLRRRQGPERSSRRTPCLKVATGMVVAAEQPEPSSTSADASAPYVPARTRKKIVFSLITVLLVVLLLEGASRVFVTLQPNERSDRHRTRIIDVLGFPELNEIFQPDNNCFWALRPNLDRHVLSGRIVSSGPLHFAVSTDAKRRRMMPVVRSAQHRILCLGDSCTFGFGVNDDQTYPALLQRRLPGVQVINAAVPGYTAYQDRVCLEKLAARPPDVVVVAFGFNDAESWDALSDIEHAELVAAERARLVNRLRLVQVVRGLFPAPEPAKPTSRGSLRPRLSDAEFADQVGTMIRWCRERGVRPILVIWPPRIQIVEREAFGPPKHYFFSSKQAVLRRTARQARVPLVDLGRAFSEHGWADLYLDAIHATPAGCELVAETLLPVVREALTRERSSP